MINKVSKTLQGEEVTLITATQEVANLNNTLQNIQGDKNPVQNGISYAIKMCAKHEVVIPESRRNFVISTEECTHKKQHFNET